MAKTFISFLGASGYIPCYYQSPFDKNETHFSTYVQDAIVRLIMKPASVDDSVILFLTGDARRKNWEDAEGRKGLRTVLENIPGEKEFSFSIVDVDIPDVKDQEGIWEVFGIAGEHIPGDCEVIFDITHAFRFLPMLGMVLVNYLRFVKNITLSGIYYGAFEKLGTPAEVENIPVEKRLAPIIDLTPFDYIMRFTGAAADFVNYGFSGSLKDMLLETVQPMLRETGGQDHTARVLREFSKRLDAVAMALATNRGLSIYEGKIFDHLRESIREVKSLENSTILNALVPVLERVEDKIAGFNTGDIRNGLEAARWCIDHNLVQQGITILQETMVTMACDKAGIDHTIRKWREFAGRALNVRGRYRKNARLGQLGEKVKEPEEIKVQEFWNMIGEDQFGEFLNIYMMLTEYRNYINHAGTLSDDNTRPVEFVDKLRDAYERLINIPFI